MRSNRHHLTSGIRETYSIIAKETQMAVPDPTKFVLHQPQKPSPAIAALMRKIESGWRPSEDLLKMSDHRAAHSLGIYIYELRNMVLPALGDKS